MERKDLRKREERLEKEIADLVREFEKETGSSVIAIEPDCYDDDEKIKVYTA